MTVEDAQKANDLILALEAGLEVQQENLIGLREALEHYQEFLMNCLKELQDV